MNCRIFSPYHPSPGLKPPMYIFLKISSLFRCSSVNDWMFFPVWISKTCISVFLFASITWCLQGGNFDAVQCNQLISICLLFRSRVITMVYSPRRLCGHYAPFFSYLSRPVVDSWRHYLRKTRSQSLTYATTEKGFPELTVLLRQLYLPFMSANHY